MHSRSLTSFKKISASKLFDEDIMNCVPAYVHNSERDGFVYCVYACS